MTTSEFKKIGRLLKVAYKELEEQALKEGIDILSDTYEEMIDATRDAVLSKYGFSLAEYREAKDIVINENKTATSKKFDLVDNELDNMSSILEEINNKIESIETPTEEDIEVIAEKIAKKYIKEPKVINQIVERIVEKRPVKETVKITERVEYDDSKLQDKIKELQEELDSIEIPKFISAASPDVTLLTCPDRCGSPPTIIVSVDRIIPLLPLTIILSHNY